MLPLTEESQTVSVPFNAVIVPKPPSWFTASIAAASVPNMLIEGASANAGSAPRIPMSCAAWLVAVATGPASISAAPAVIAIPRPTDVVAIAATQYSRDRRAETGALKVCRTWLPTRKPVRWAQAAVRQAAQDC
jgi:hypothetical protein